MLFNLFGKKESTEVEGVFKDRVFIGIQGKMNACARLAKEQDDTIFIAWFPDTQKNFLDFFKQEGIDESRVTDVKHIHSGKLQNHTPVFVEHHPLHAKEITVIQSWNQKNILVYSSLDEPLFKHFGSDKVIPLIKMMGMKENEPIEHSMVSKSIASSQEKIAEKVQLEQSANSQGEWVKKNLS